MCVLDALDAIATICALYHPYEHLSGRVRIPRLCFHRLSDIRGFPLLILMYIAVPDVRVRLS